MVRPLITKQYSYSIILILATFAIFYPALNNLILDAWDDQFMVMNHYTEGGFTTSNLWAILTEYYGGQYAPAYQYLMLIIYSLFGYNPIPFHLANILLHSGSAILIFFTLRKILTSTTRVRVDNADTIAFITALIFTIHPLNVEVVAWITAVKISIYAFFYLAATATYVCYLEKRKLKYYIFTILLFFLSFGGKEQAVTFPIWLIMLSWILGYDFRNRKLWIPIIPIFLLAVFFGLVTMWSQEAGGGGVLTNQETYPLWQCVVFACYSLFEYLTKFIVPYNLMYIYPFPMVIGEPLPTWLLIYPSLIIVALITLWKYIKKWPIVCGMIFFLIHMALVLHIIPMSRFVIVADRYIYIACIGLAFIVAYYLVQLHASLAKRGRTALIFFVSLAFLALGVTSNIRCRAWKNTESIKKEVRELIEQRDDYVAPMEEEEEIREETTEENKNL